MILTEKETTTIKDLQTQEQSCIQKYENYSKQAKETKQLKELPARLTKPKQKKK